MCYSGVCYWEAHNGDCGFPRDKRVIKKYQHPICSFDIDVDHFDLIVKDINNILNQNKMNGVMEINFLKENGYPVTLYINSIVVGDEYETVVTTEVGVEIKKFVHSDLRARINWVDGYYSALRNEKMKKNDIFCNKNMVNSYSKHI